MGLIDTLNGMIKIPEKGDTKSSRTIVEIPDVGTIGFGVNGRLSDSLRDGLEQLEFPENGVSDEEVAQIRTVASEVPIMVDRVREFVAAQNTIGDGMVDMLELNQKFNEAQFKRANQVQQIDLKNAEAAGLFQNKTAETVSAFERKRMELKAKQGLM